MSEFLHQLRNGNDKRFNRKRRQYDGNQNVLYDRRASREPRRNAQRDRDRDTEQSVNVPYDMMESIKDLLENIVENQERQIITETRKADALDRLVEVLSNLPGGVPTEKVQADNENPVESAVESAVDSAAEPAVEPPVKKRKRVSRKKDDPRRLRVMEIIESMRQENATYHEIAMQLEEEDLPTFSGRGKWHAQTVHRLCKG